MQRKKLSQAISILFISCILSGFNWIFYRPDIQQGNIIVEEQINRLRLGMTKEEVEKILGKSLLSPEPAQNNPADEDTALIAEEIDDSIRVNYVYRYAPGYGEPILKKVSLLFEDEKLVDISVT